MYYTCSIGSHTFQAVEDGFTIETDEVVRTNVTPNRLVARYYRWLVRGRITASTPAATATALLSMMTACVNPSSGTIPTSFKIIDASSAALAQIGDVRTGTSEEWEDLQVTSFEMLDQSLVDDAQFEVGFSARRSFPDANGICEFTVKWVGKDDDVGNATRTRVTEIRLAKSSANTIAGSDGTGTGTAAIAALLTETKPVGWRRTAGGSRGYEVEFLQHPLLHHAICTSEVTRNAGGANPPAGANTANTRERIVDDPEKGVRRYFYEVESVGSTDGLTWVEGQRLADAWGETESRPEEKTYRGKWQRLEALASPAVGKITRQKRTYQRIGGEREGGAILMSAPHDALVTRGPWTATRIVETVRIYALGVSAAGDADIPLPAPLPAPWRLVEPIQHPDPSVDEESRYPAQRLWTRSAIREYLWGGRPGAPESDASYVAALFADASVEV